MPHLRSTWVIVCLGLGITLAGCKPADEITSYRVPKPPPETEFRTARLSGTVPDGWIRGAPSGPFPAEVAFKMVGDGRMAEATASVLEGKGGGLLANVNRWRGQMKLEETTEEQLRNTAQKIEVAGLTADYVDLLGPESAGEKRERLLGVIVPRGGATWFFRLRGPAELVGKQKSAFETFVKSVRFSGSSN